MGIAKEKSTEGIELPRIPLPVGGVQVNFCKNPSCANFGIPAQTTKQRSGSGSSPVKRDTYNLSRTEKGVPTLKCKFCGEHPTIKSNLAIHEEYKRLTLYMKSTKGASCPTKSCGNHQKTVERFRKNYQSYGTTHSGSKRYWCKQCHATFAVGVSTLRQRAPHKNKIILKLLVNKSPFRRIMEVADISSSTLYSKINFLQSRCLAFVAERERRFATMNTRRLYISVDRQDYLVNWSKRVDKRNVVLSAVGSADNETGYMFGMNLNFDSVIDAKAIEKDAFKVQDHVKKPAFRKYARLWLDIDYEAAIHRLKKRIAPKKGDLLSSKIDSTYTEALGRDDIEVEEASMATRRLPAKGMQIHAEYTLYGHFLMLKSLFKNVEKVRFFLDQDPGMRAACLSAFSDDIKRRTCDAFYVKINKNMTIDEKQKALADSRKQFNAVQKANSELSNQEVKLLILKEQMKQFTTMGKWRDKWLRHPFPNMSEPEKASCYMTDMGDYDVDHLAWLYNKASLHGIDRFFMQVRRRLSILERPISSPSSAGRRWYGYSPYNPEVIVKLLNIFRVYYNYAHAGQDKKTPAMRLGLAKGIVALEDIIYFNGKL